MICERPVSGFQQKRSESASVGEGVLGEVESGEFMDKN